MTKAQHTIFWKYHRPVFAALLLLFVFVKLGQHPVSPWDEARTGVNAMEMLINHDWVNLHYAGKPDNWRAKPPLVEWCVAASFSVFGFNELSLRLPSAISIILAFFFIYKIITLYKSQKFAFWTCMILLSAKGLIGWHIGRTGDHDAMLVFMLLGGLYFYLLWFDFDKKNKVYWAALFFGLAFMAKGPAMAVYFPGIAMYALLRGRFRKLIASKEAWLAILVCAVIPIAWYLIVNVFGVVMEDASSGKNVVEWLFIYDIWERFTENEAGWKKAFEFDFFFYSIDKLLPIWGIVFFGVLATGLGRFVYRKGKVKDFFSSENERLLLLSLCIYFPLALFLAMASKSHSWYMAPVLPFVGIIVFRSITGYVQKCQKIAWIFYGLLAFTLVLQLVRLTEVKSKPEIITNSSDLMTKADSIYVVGTIEQDVLLYIYFQNQRLVFKKDIQKPKHNDLVFLASGQQMDYHGGNFDVEYENEKYKILKIKN